MVEEKEVEGGVKSMSNLSLNLFFSLCSGNIPSASPLMFPYVSFPLFLYAPHTEK